MLLHHLQMNPITPRQSIRPAYIFLKHYYRHPAWVLRVWGYKWMRTCVSSYHIISDFIWRSRCCWRRRWWWCHCRWNAVVVVVAGCRSHFTLTFLDSFFGESFFCSFYTRRSFYFCTSITSYRDGLCECWKLLEANFFDTGLGSYVIRW